MASDPCIAYCRPNLPTVDTITNAVYKTHEKENESIDDYENVTVSNPLEKAESQDMMHKPEEHYLNVTAAQRWGQESDEDYGDSEVAYTAVSHSHAPDTPLYDAVYHS